jgi:peroxiredoxin
MKKTILLVLAACPVLLFAQEKYTITGKIASISAPAKIYLTYRADGEAVTDSSAIKSGVFTFKGEVEAITKSTLSLDHKGVGITNISRKTKQDVLDIYLVTGTTVVTSADSLADAKVTGTKVNDDYQVYAAMLKPVNDAYQALNNEYYATPKEKRASKEFGDYIDKKEDSIGVKEKSLDSLYIIANPNSYMSLQALKSMGRPYPDYTQLQPKFNALSANIRATKGGVAYQKYLNILKAVSVGSIAPEFAQADTNGKMVNLSSFRGKYVLIDFWASWCGPCRAENPNVVKAYNTYKGKNFTILGVSLDRPGKKDAWLKAIRTDGLAWHHVSDLKFWDNEAAKLYGIQAIPQNLLLGPDGKIIAKDLFGDDLEKKLAELLGKI